LKVHVLEQEVVLNAPLERVFDYFSKAENLEKLTPKSLVFKILTPMPIVMATGAEIDYKLTLIGIGFKWRTKIALWDPPHRFIDDQLKGPYRIWYHTHSFVAEGERSKMTDQVQFQSPGWIFEPLIHRLFVKPRVEEIFRFRNQAMNETFGVSTTSPMRFSDREFRPNN
jgi:ligand-binding SRPBCC domain-containing protein